jgi:hypothetical protein
VLGRSGVAPYTEDEEAKTTRRTPLSRAASMTLSVPITFDELLVSGSWIERGTEGIAAWCSTMSMP